MAVQNKVSLPVIKRLPKYYRYLTNLSADGKDKISSSELAHMMGTTASQVRQDFNCFGGFGQQGIGYKVDVLRAEIGNLLFGDGEKLPTILVGAGRLGSAVSSFISRDANGYKLLGVFDVNPDLIGKEMCGVPILPLSDLDKFCAEHHPEVAVLCVPRQSAMDLAGELVNQGIKGFWNFSHYDLSVEYPDVTVENVHLGDSLMSLGYRLRNQEKVIIASLSKTDSADMWEVARQRQMGSGASKGRRELSFDALLTIPGRGKALCPRACGRMPRSLAVINKAR